MFDARVLPLDATGGAGPERDSSVPQRAARNIARLLPGHPLVGITAWGNDGLEVLGWSNRLAEELEHAQSRCPDTPALDVVRTGHPILVGDLVAERRWDQFCERLLARGMRSLYCQPLVAEAQLLGLLTLYSEREDAFLPRP
ncbi:GAF domain-containing protein [Nocardia higoensis]|uniref:GAF domain-containing protein n=1 Tax=Nocardia higoensis TaxID=228599 RepID=A0ABS0D455_9NOCA|nr:GAF domain-containing protein [Nocardia higoensis]MBF6353259.1 GAF domain-containing protein [Nocardia higoensis]